MQHELREHFAKDFWPCTSCDAVLTTIGALQLHQTVHGRSPSLSLYLTNEERVERAISATSCHLCRQGVANARAYVSHVGKHLERIALAALPRGEDEFEEEQGAEQAAVELPSSDDGGNTTQNQKVNNESTVGRFAPPEADTYAARARKVARQLLGNIKGSESSPEREYQINDSEIALPKGDLNQDRSSGLKNRDQVRGPSPQRDASSLHNPLPEDEIEYDPPSNAGKLESRICLWFCVCHPFEKDPSVRDWQLTFPQCYCSNGPHLFNTNPACSECSHARCGECAVESH